MQLTNKINNYLLLLLAAYIPFYSTFTSGSFRIGDFKFLYLILVTYKIAYAVFSNSGFKFVKIGKLTTSLILFFVAQLISGLLADDIDLAIEKLFVEFQFLVVYLIINSMVINHESYKNIFKGILIGFVLSCAIALLQFFGFKQFNIYSDSELNHNAGLITEHSVKVLRIWGPFGNSLTFSEYLSIAGISLYSFYRFINKNLLFSFIVLLLSFICSYLTLARTALFATAFALIFIELIYTLGSSSKKATYLILFSIILVFTVLLFSPGIQDNGNPIITRFANVSQDLKAGRLNLWIKGYEAFLGNVFLGVGPGNLHSALSAKGFPMTSEIIAQYDGQHVENYFLTILYTYGLLGIFFCIRIFFYLVNYSFKLFELLKGKIESFAYGGAMMGAVIAFIINNFTNPALIFDQRIKMMFIFVIVVINNSFFTFDQLNFFKKSAFLRILFTKK
jgi:hypothetical protein